MRNGFDRHEAAIAPYMPLVSRTKPDLIRSNLAHQAATRAKRVRAEVEILYGRQCVRLARALKLDVVSHGPGRELRRKLQQVTVARNGTNTVVSRRVTSCHSVSRNDT